jgi:hypothetical protein
MKSATPTHVGNVRAYLILLFAVVAGLGVYLIASANNAHFDEDQQYINKDLTSTPAPTPTPTASPVSAATPAESTLAVAAEASALTELLATVPETDFADSGLEDSALGL